MGLLTFNNDKVLRSVYDKIISEHKKIDVISGKCRYNFRCQMNAVHEARRKGDKKVAMVMYMDDRKIYPIIHFINYRKGKFVDNTLGEWSQCHDYYLIKFIKEDEFWDINHIFTSYRSKIRNSLSWWMKITSDEAF
jgi:hypothetical protein